MTISTGLTNSSLSGFEKIAFRPYFVATAATEVMQMVSKVAMLIFSSMISGLTFGQSKVINEWTRSACTDVYSSCQQIYYSFSGLIDPEKAMDKKIQISEGIHELGKFSYKEVIKANLIEKNILRLQFLANSINELIGSLFIFIRWVMSKVVSTIEFGPSNSFKSYTFSNFLSLSSHLSYMIGSFEGCIFPGYTLSNRMSNYD